MDLLKQVFIKAPDPRAANTQYRTAPVLVIIALALLAGRREIAEIARFATTLTQPQRRRLGLPRKKGTRAFYRVPGYDVFYQVLTRMDPESFAQLLSQWLHSPGGDFAGRPGDGWENDPRPHRVADIGSARRRRAASGGCLRSERGD